MFDLDHWREIYETLWRNKVRTLLTAFGVFWGIFLLMVMLGSGQGLENGVAQGFTGHATNSFFLWGRATTRPYRGMPSGRPIQMTTDDAAALRARLAGAQVIAPRIQLGGFEEGNNVSRGDRAGGFAVMGDHPAIQNIQPMVLELGRFINPLDLEHRRKVAVIGTRVRDILFAKGENPIGESVRIRGVYFLVVGVFRSLQTGEDAEEDAQTLFVPFTTFQKAFRTGDRVGWFAVTARPGWSAADVLLDARSVLYGQHRVDPMDVRSFGSFNLEEEYLKIIGVFQGIRWLVWIVGLGTLAAGVIGVSNILSIVVKERTQEIGIRRAVGATPVTVVGQVIQEAVILTAVAGCLGLMAGVAAVESVAWFVARAENAPEMFLQPGVSLSSALLALAVLVGSGALAGLIPAQQAVSLRPVDALRAE
ncbi:MAG: ABC transporter permease [Acidobacteriota bacterium]